jgi:type II secretion system protein H
VVEYRRVIAEMPDHSDAHHLLGVIALGQGLYAEAVQLLTVAVLIRPDSAQYTKSLGSALIASGDPEAAAVSFAAAVRLQPSYPAAYYGLGSALCLQGRYREAAYNFYRALICRPRYAEARRNLTAALSKLRFMSGNKPIKRNVKHLERNIRMLATQQDTWPDQDPGPSGELSHGPNDKAGFTLLETLVVLVVLSLMAGLVLARGPSRSPSFEVRTAASNLAQTLRGARATAILTGEPTRVEVDLLGRRARTSAGALLVPASIRLTYTAVSGRTVAAGRAIVAFGADGSSSGGAFGLFMQAVRGVVTIDAFTGRVDVVDGA